VLGTSHVIRKLEPCATGIAVGFKRRGNGERGSVTGDNMMMMMISPKNIGYM